MKAVQKEEATIRFYVVLIFFCEKKEGLLLTQRHYF